MIRCRYLRSQPIRRYQEISISYGKHRYISCRGLTTEGTGLKPYYVTTPIFYPNAVPHIGHLYSLVTADIFARFHRLTHPHQPVHFLTGTDEHGLKIQKAAREQGLPEKDFCDAISARFRELAEKADISHTRFIRTTEQAHHDAVTHLWHGLKSQGLIYKDLYAGWYSVSDESFYTDSQITRGIDPATHAEVVTSTETGSLVTYSSEETYKFRLSAFRARLLDHFLANPDAIQPKSYYDQVIRQLSDGSEELEDLSISRPRSRLEWGVRVPGDEDQTIYVWVDALTVYLTGAGYAWTGNRGGEIGGWPVDLQIIGKDILRFHAIYFPAMLLALSLPLPKTLLAHAHWTTNQKKMSKSLGNVADPMEAMDEYGVDGVRYYMARVGGRFKDDVDWSKSEALKHRLEVGSLLGNFFMRITSVSIQVRFSGMSEPLPTLAHMTSPSGYMEGNTSHNNNLETLSLLEPLGSNVRSSLERLEVADALEQIMLCLKQANAAMTAIQPWSSDPLTTHATYVTSLETLRVCGICLQPFIPDTSRRLLDALGVKSEERTWEFTEVGKGIVNDVEGVKLFESKEKPSGKQKGQSKKRQRDDRA